MVEVSLDLAHTYNQELIFGHRILFMNLAGFVARTKYYSVWCIA